MKILFLDPSLWAYDADTPATRPMGGTQSGVCYLSPALAALGHEVTVINGTPEPVRSGGVDFVTLPQSAEFLNSFDVVVIVTAAFGTALRTSGYTGPLVLWCHHAIDQGAVQRLLDPTERDSYRAFAMVSQWQADTYVQAFQLNPDRVKVLRNAVSPFFLEPRPRSYWFDRGDGPVMAYSSAPFRGLDILLLGFPLIRSKFPNARLRVYSSMNMYTPQEAKDPSFASLYELCRALDGVEYVGALPQPQLAEAMADVDILSYSCHFPETSCIVAMEAMASGALVIATDKGALPETTAGFAHLVDFQNVIYQPGILATHYAHHFIEAAAKFAADPQATREHLARQVAYIRDFTWSQRAVEWSRWLDEIVRAPVAA